MRKNILLIVFGMIIAIGIGVVANSIITADQVEYDANSSVKDKIDDLYDATGKYESVSFNLLNYTSSSLLSVSSYSLPTTYKHFKLTSLTNTSAQSCYVTSYSGTQSQDVTLSVNTEYNIRNQADYAFTNINVTSKSIANNTWSNCSVNVTLYN